MPLLSVVIPALNEQDNIEQVIASVPSGALARAGWRTEVLVVDNASTDGTAALARACGAKVVFQPVRGYGSAYAAGFAVARGEVIVTGDADRTYPFDDVPRLLRELRSAGAVFLTTDRLHRRNRKAMKRSHAVGNHVLSLLGRVLFRHRIRDSQSGMWMFERGIWPQLDVRSGGMAFSQELKNEVARRGLAYVEVPIEYRPRGGQVKLNALRDGWANARQLFEHARRPIGWPAERETADLGPLLRNRGPAPAAEPDGPGRRPPSLSTEAVP